MYLGYALRKMARELGLEVKDGVVCGIFKRYAVSMWEGLSGTKTFSISAKFDDKLYEKLDKDFSELEYKYQRLLYIRFMDDTLTAEFSDNPGTMKQFRNCFFDVLSMTSMISRMQISVLNADFPCMDRAYGPCVRS